MTRDSNGKSLSETWLEHYDPEGMGPIDRAGSFSQTMREDGRTDHFFLHRIQRSGGIEARLRSALRGRENRVLLLNSSSYLGLDTDPRVVEASRKAAASWGCGTGTVSMYGGLSELHRELERKLAQFYGKEDCMLFPSGYAANLGALSGLLRGRDRMIGDLLNHSSIQDGCRLSGARFQAYSHTHLESLERVLLQRSSRNPPFVVTDGVFSMDGDVAPLPRICELISHSGAYLMVDEAHALGVVGPGGRGTGAEFGLDDRIALITGTLSKAAGGVGGYVVSSREIIDYLRYYARPYGFSASLPPSVVGGLIEAMEIISQDSGLHRRLWRNIRQMKEGLRSLGFDMGRSQSAIIPVIFHDEKETGKAFHALLEAGIFVNFVIFPAVARNRPRLRVSLSAKHTSRAIDRVLDVFSDLKRTLDLETRT